MSILVLSSCGTFAERNQGYIVGEWGVVTQIVYFFYVFVVFCRNVARGIRDNVGRSEPQGYVYLE